MSEYNKKLLDQIIELEDKYGSFDNMPPEIQKKYRELQDKFRFEE